MSGPPELIGRSQVFAQRFDRGDLPIPSRLSTLVVACMDARVNPSFTLGLDLGDAFVLRSAGGRVNDGIVRDIALLGWLMTSMPGGGPERMDVMVIQHTNCGMARLADPSAREQVASLLGVDTDIVGALAVTDPAVTVAADVERLRGEETVPGEWFGSGYVYDVASGVTEEIVAPSRLR